LDGASQWLGLPGHRTSHQWTSFYVATLKPWFRLCQLIMKSILLPVLSKPYVWTSALNWYEIHFFSIHQWFCLISNLVRTNLTVRSAARTHLRHTITGPWIYIFVLVSPITPWSLGIEFFRILYIHTHTHTQ
jgi:hypothetical protein